MHPEVYRRLSGQKAGMPFGGPREMARFLGDIALPANLDPTRNLAQHLVDSVVRIEGDRNATLRTLRCLKHRFGPTDEVGLMEMVAGGMADLVDPARSLAGSGRRSPGS